MLPLPLLVTLATYNALAAKSPDQLHDIERALHADVIALQGTRRRARAGVPVSYSARQGYHFFDAGWEPGACSHAGVSLHLRERTFPRGRLVATV